MFYKIIETDLGTVVAIKDYDHDQDVDLIRLFMYNGGAINEANLGYELEETRDAEFEKLSVETVRAAAEYICNGHGCDKLEQD